MLRECAKNWNELDRLSFSLLLNDNDTLYMATIYDSTGEWYGTVVLF